MVRQSIVARVRVKAPAVALIGLFIILVSFMSAVRPVAAATSSNLNFQARLLGSTGAVVADGTYNIDFKIYNADSTTGSVGTCSGACLWEETRKVNNSQGVTVTNGYFSVNLGSVTSFPAINWDQQLWLTMNIGGTTNTASPTWDGEMQNAGHSISLTALPYAFIAGQLALTSGANRGTLSFSTVANNPAVLLPDASGTICLQAAAACGFETTTGTDFIQNQNASPQTANFNITGSGVIGTSLLAPLVQTADSAVGNTTAIVVRSGNQTGSSLSSGGVSIKSGDAAGGTNSSSGNVTIDSGTKSGSGTTGSISLGTGNASSVTIGNSSQTGATTITSGLSGISLTAATTISPSANSAVALTINATSGTAATAAVITQSKAGADALDINLTNTSGTITDGLALNLNGSGGTATNGIHIIRTVGTLGNGISFTGVIGVDVARAVGTLTIQGGGGVNISSAGGASTSAINLQSGNATSGNSGNIALDVGTATGTTGVINIGTANASGITIGNSSQSAATTITAGASGIALSANTTVANDKSFTAGGTALFKDNTNTTTAFQIQNAAGTNIVQVDSTTSRFGIGKAPSLMLDVLGGINSDSNVQAPHIDATNSLRLTSSSANNAYISKNTVISGTVAINDVLILDTTPQAADTTTARDFRVFGVATAGQTGGSEQVAISGNFTVNATTNGGANPISIGDRLVTSTTSGMVQVDNKATTGILGYALSALASGTGTVSVYIQPINGQYAPTFRNASDSTAAFQIQNAAGTSNLFVADTTNSRIGIGKVPTLSTLDVNGSIYASSEVRGNGLRPNTSGSTGQWTSGGVLNIVPSGSSNNAVDITATLGATYSGISLNQNGLGTSASIAQAGTGDILNVIDGTVAAGTSVFRIVDEGAATFQNKTNSTTAFQIQNANAKSVMAVDTTGGQVVLGTAGASGVTGQLKLNYAGQSGSITLASANPSSTNYTITIPAETGTLCTTAASVACTAVYAAAGGTYLQKNTTDTSTGAAGAGNLYVFTNNSSASTGGVLKLDNGSNTGSALYVTTSGNPASGSALLYAQNTNASPTGNLLDLRSGSTPTSKFSVDASGNLSSVGAITNTLNSTTAFQVQNSGAVPIFNANTTDGYIINNGIKSLGNEIDNPGFEALGTSEASGWYTPSASQVLTNDSTNARTGNRELQITGNSSTHAVTTKYFAVHPGDQVYAETYVKNSAGANGDAGIYLEFSDKDKGGATFTNADTGLPGTSYIVKSITTTVPAGKTFVRIAISVKATATTGTFYFDDVYLKRINEQAPLLLSNVSTTAFQVQNASSQTVLGVDTSTSKIFTTIPDGGSAIGFLLNTPSYTTSGAKLLSLQNNGTPKFSVDKDGNIVNAGAIAASGNVSLSGTITGATTITGSGNFNTTGGALQTNSVTRVDNSGNLSGIGNFTATAGSTFSTTGANGFTFKAGTDNATTFQVQNAASSKAVLTVDTTGNKTILGAAGASGVTGTAQFNYSGSSGSITIAPLDPTSTAYTLSLPAETGTFCTSAAASTSTCTNFASASGVTTSLAGKLNKGAVDTSSAAVTAVQGNLYAFTNSSSAIASSVLKLDNGNNTESALVVTGSANYAAGKAYILVNDTNGSPSGNLIDLQISAASKFSVDIAGNVAATGNVNIGSAKQYQINGVSINTNGTLTNVAYLGQNQTFSGNNTFSSASNSFTGDGSGLTSLNATNVSSGTLNDGRLSSNVALLNRAGQSFTGDNTFAPTSNNAGTTIKQTSGTATSGSVLDVQTANGTSHFIQITNAAANEGAVTLQSVGATRDLTLGSGSGTIIVAAAANTIKHSNSGLTIDVNNGTDSLFTITNAQGGAVASLSVEGDISVAATRVYKVGATSGVNSTCSSNTFTQNQVVTGGLTTGASCANAVTTVNSAGGSISNGASISGNAISFGYADTSNPGLVSIGSQTIGGNKQFNGAVTVANTSTTAFQVQNAGGTSILVVDSSGRQLKVMENAGSTNYSLIYYDTATSTANYTASAGTVAVGTGAGAITVTAGSGSAVNITGNATSLWKTTAGTLTLQSGTGGSDYLILNGGGSGQVQVNGSAVVKLGAASADPTCTNGAIYYNTTSTTFRGCQNSAWATLGTITPTLQSTYTQSTGGTTPEIKVDSTRGAVDIQDADSTIGGIIFAVRGSNAGGLGTSLLNVNTATNSIQIGSSSSHSTAASILVLDNYANSGADPTGIAGALYYNGTNGKFRCYDGTWRDCMTGFNEITKTSDQAATQSSTTFQNDSTLAFAMAASTNYVFDAWIPVDSSNATATGKYTFTVPAGAVLNISGQSYSSASANTICNVTSSGQTGCTLTSSAVNFIQVRGFVRNSTTAGNMQFQFAQNTSTAASFPVVKAGAVLNWRTAN